MKIKLEDVRKSYFLNKSAEVKVLKGIDLSVEKGEIVSIIGPSGAGKSTLLHILGLMDSQTAGKVILGDFDCSAASDDEKAKLRNKKIGFLFQMHYLLPEFTIYENIAIPVWNKKHEMKKYIDSLLDATGLKDRVHHLPTEISGGELQRAALVRALVNSPEVLLCDEPTGNLDRETGEKVENLIIKNARENNITTVIVTHNPDLASKTDRIIKMKDGLLV